MAGLTAEKQDDLLNELIALRNSVREYNIQIPALKTEVLALKANLEYTETLLKVCVDKLQSLDKKK
ncbi:MAG TPA: hypothetical protein VJ201_03270 [Candidatus Babeliales bacterium]|nr:hypothetical protein [Candidatus Babeliales bacterium]